MKFLSTFSYLFVVCQVSRPGTAKRPLFGLRVKLPPASCYLS